MYGYKLITVSNEQIRQRRSMLDTENTSTNYCCNNAMTSALVLKYIGASAASLYLVIPTLTLSVCLSWYNYVMDRLDISF